MRFKKRSSDGKPAAESQQSADGLAGGGEGSPATQPTGTPQAGDSASGAGATDSVPTREPVTAPGAGPRIAGRFAYDGLERLLHERARLSILSSLSAHPSGLLFNDLKSLCALTDGNLSRQLQTLQEGGLVEVWKSHRGSRPQTLCRLTSSGKERFLEYVNVLEGVVADALSAEAPGHERTPLRSGRPASNL